MDQAGILPRTCSAVYPHFSAILQEVLVLFPPGMTTMMSVLFLGDRSWAGIQASFQHTGWVKHLPAHSLLLGTVPGHGVLPPTLFLIFSPLILGHINYYASPC